jgi:hypothetical protein
VMRELATRGGFAVGPLLNLGRRTVEESDTREVAKALLELPAASLPGLIGAIDVPDRDWQRRIVHVLLLRAEIGEDVKAAQPALQILLADKGLHEDTRLLATKLLSHLRGVEAKRLPAIPDMLSETADQMYQGTYAFPEGTANQVFRGVPGRPGRRWNRNRGMRGRGARCWGYRSRMSWHGRKRRANPTNRSAKASLDCWSSWPVRIARL